MTRNKKTQSQCAGGLNDLGETARPKDTWFGIPHGPSISKNIFLKSPPGPTYIIKKIKTVERSKETVSYTHLTLPTIYSV